MSGRVRCILAPAALVDVSRGIDGTPLRRVHCRSKSDVRSIMTSSESVMAIAVSVRIAPSTLYFGAVQEIST